MTEKNSDAPRVYVPYAWYDKGLRPLPPELSPYLCDTIWPGGRPGRTIARGEEVSVQFSINCEAPNDNPVPIQTEVFWMALGTAGASPQRFGKPRSSTIGRGQWGTVHRGTIPINAPDHICLLVATWTMQEGGPGPMTSAANFHWAQLNLSVERVKAGQSFSSDINVGNPLEVEQTYYLNAGIVRGDKRLHLAASTGTGLMENPVVDYGLADSISGRSERTNDSLTMQVTLAPLEDRVLRLDGYVEGEPGQAIAIEVIQRASNEDMAGIGGATLIFEIE